MNGRALMWLSVAALAGSESVSVGWCTPSFWRVVAGCVLGRQAAVCNACIGTKGGAA